MGVESAQGVVLVETKVVQLDVTQVNSPSKIDEIVQSREERVTFQTNKYVFLS